jgi:hypothetical protein
LDPRRVQSGPPWGQIDPRRGVALTFPDVFDAASRGTLDAAAWSPHLWCLTFAMEDTVQAILDGLPPRRRRSKLEPYAALIRALRARGRSYREIVTILRERCGLRVAMHTVYHFVRARAQKQGTRRPARRRPSEPARGSAAGVSSSPRAPDAAEDVWTRIAAIKQRAPAAPGEPKAFEFDESEPLQLIADDTRRRR